MCPAGASWVKSGTTAWVAAWPGQPRRGQEGRRRRGTPQPWRPGPWAVKFGRNVGPRKGAGIPGGPDPGNSPQASHSLGNDGTNEGHVNSTPRRTKDFMGIFRSTPPCDGSVLGPPGRVLQSRRARCRWPRVLTQGPGRPATVDRSAQAQPV